MDDLRLETISDAARFGALGGVWDPLVRGVARPSPFLLHGWLDEWWRHYGAGRRLAVVAAWRGDRLVGALPLFVGRHRGVRRAEFLGGHESALADALLAPGEPAATAGALVARFRDEGGDGYADLFGIPAGSPLLEICRGAGAAVVERVAAPVLEMPDGWEAAYAAKTSSKTRNTHRRKRKALAAQGALVFRVCREPAELQVALREAQRLHALRWEGRPDRSEFVTPTGTRFHAAALARIAPLDVVRIVLCELDGVAIAHHYYFALDGRMVVHCLAFDPAYAAASVGLLTNLETLAIASEEGLRSVEFLGGDERYKLELADRMAPLHQAVGLASGVRGRVAVAGARALLAARLRLRDSDRARRLHERGLAPVRRLRTRLQAR